MKIHLILLTFHLVLLKTAESELSRSSSSSSSCFTCKINLQIAVSLLALKTHLRLCASATRSFQTVPLLYNVLALPRIQRQCLHHIKHSIDTLWLSPSDVFLSFNNNETTNRCTPCSSKSNICSLVVSKKSNNTPPIGSNC